MLAQWALATTPGTYGFHELATDKWMITLLRSIIIMIMMMERRTFSVMTLFLW